MPSDWCEIFVDGVEDVRALVPLVSTAAHGRIDDTSVTSAEGIDIYVGTNSTNPRFARVPPKTDFNVWPFVIDLGVDEERGIPLVTAMLRKLWNRDLRAGAVCSFEEKLPRSGGYRDGQLILTDD